MNILIYGSFGEGNVGDEVILDQLLSSLNKSDHIVVVSKDPDYTRKNFSLPAIHEHHTFDLIRIIRHMLLLRMKHLWHRLTLFIEIFKSDVLVLGGGGIITEVHYNELHKYLQICRVAKRMNKKVIVNCVGVGPLITEKGKREINNTFNHFVDFVSVRDNISYQLLKECGVNNDIIVTPDPAFNYQLPKQKKMSTAVINLYDIFRHKDKKEERGLFIDSIVEFITHLKVEHSYHIKFVPFGVNADRQFMKEIQSLLNFDIEILHDDHFYKNITDFMADATFSLTMRFHAGLLSLANSIPSICIDNQFKSERLLEDMGLSAELLIDLPNGIHKTGDNKLTSSLLIDKFNGLMSNYEQIIFKINDYAKNKRAECLSYRENKLKKALYD